MSLAEYKKKRDFSKTPEPLGKKKRSTSGRRYLIQKHAASRLHYDFRLELDGTLKSWAVPKGPSYDPTERRLAVHVEDHPIEYGDFEGTIPEGQYGAGTVMVWDKGTWEPLDDNPSKAYREGKLKFIIRGKKLQGAWALIRMKSRDADDKADNWLLIKEKDEHADPARDVTEEMPDSAVSGRSLEQIAADNDREWQSDRPASRRTRNGFRAKLRAVQSKKARTTAAPRRSRTDVAGAQPSAEGAVRKPFPSTVKPQLCTLVKSIPMSPDWLHEVKFDGYRIVAFINNGKVALKSRNSKDWTKRFPDVAEACSDVAKQCVLDGEVVVVRDDGTTDFQALQNLLRANKRPTVAYYVFDVLYLDGYDLTGSPLIVRKDVLRQLTSGQPENGVLRYSEHVQGHGSQVFANACKLGLEGVVSKQANSPYIQTRGAYWVKVKCIKSQEFVIGGYTDPSGARNEFGALLLGYYDNGKLVYAGRVGTGFTEANRQDSTQV